MSVSLYLNFGLGLKDFKSKRKRDVQHAVIISNFLAVCRGIREWIRFFVTDCKVLCLFQNQ